MAEIIKECDNCKYVMTDTESFPCNRCTRNAVDKWEPIPKQTNADRIRSMTDEELAEFLIRQHACDCCDYYGKGARCKAPDGFVCTNGYASAIIQKWLQSEAE